MAHRALLQLLVCSALCWSLSLKPVAASNWKLEHDASLDASIMSSYRSQVERETMCFRNTNVCKKTSANGHADGHAFVQDTMTCSTCPGAHPGGYNHQHGDDNEVTVHPDITPALSSCTWDWQVMSDCMALTHKPGVKVCGSYKGMCHLAGSSKGMCSFPKTCEDTVLAVQGVVYEVAAAVRVGPSSQATSTCPTSGRKVTPNNHVNRAAKHQAATPKAQMVSAGKALILDGTFTVHASHSLMFESGSHQYSIFEGQTTEVPIEDAQGCARLGDGVHKLTFVSDHPVRKESGKYYQEPHKSWGPTGTCNLQLDPCADPLSQDVCTTNIIANGICQSGTCTARCEVASFSCQCNSECTSSGECDPSAGSSGDPCDLLPTIPGDEGICENGICTACNPSDECTPIPNRAPAGLPCCALQPAAAS